MCADHNNKEEALRLAVSERPDLVPLRVALAEWLVGEGRRLEALAVLRDGLFFAAGREDRLRELAEAFVFADSWPDAVEALQAAARLAPDDGNIPARLAWLWAALGEADKAAEAAARARALGVAVTLQVSGIPTEASTRQLFNQYAAGFDAHLVGGLAYSAPAALAEALAPYKERFSGRTVIDLGCGTGLMGELLRPDAGRLIGIDLSPGMLEQARGKALYDELAEGDVVEDLARRKENAALIAAADVLVYIGDLAPLFAASLQRLEAGGLFAFTVERNPGNGFALNAARRYSHAEAYLYRLAAGTGFAVLNCAPIVPRHDAGKPVDGLLVVMEKNSPLPHGRGRPAKPGG